MTWPTQALLMVPIAAALLFAALHDVAFRWIPNWVSAALAAIGLALRVFDHHILAGLGCGLGVFLTAAMCWRRGWLGGGDVKLLAASAIVVPPAQVLPFIAAVALAGGVLALAYLALGRLVPRPRAMRTPGAASERHRPRHLLRRVMAAETRRIRRGGPLPYATAISSAALLMLARG